MKKVLVLLLSLFLLTGCDFFGSNGKEKTVSATYYPFEYATNYLYGDMSTINSIYPSEVNTFEYELTSKQKESFAKADIFVYSGLTKEVDYAVSFLNTNQDLNIVDATKGLTYNNDISELWLNPSNYLMIARNIKTTLLDYDDNVYNQNKIETNYNKLKIAISELDVEYTMMCKNSTKKYILVADDSLEFLSKYNITVYTLNQKNDSYSKNISEVKKLVLDGKISNVYVIAGKEYSDDIKVFINDNDLETIEIEPLYTLSEDQRRNGDDYYTIMKSNIEKFKTELFS